MSREHLRPLSPAKQIERLEQALDRSERELDSTRRVLQDCMEERGLPRLFLFSFLDGGLENGYVALVIAARNEREAQAYVEQWGEARYPELGPWAHNTVQELGPLTPGIISGSDDE